MMKQDYSLLIKELQFRSVRSSGPGGQHVNKTSSKVWLAWSIPDSEFFDAGQKAVLMARLSHRLTKDGVLRLSCDSERSQRRNKEKVTERFLRLLQRTLAPVKKRIPTRPGKKSVEKRLERKKKRGRLKKERRSDF